MNHCLRASVDADLNMASAVDIVCVCVSPSLLLLVHVCVPLCVLTPLAFSQFSRTSLIQQEWKSFLHGVHRRQKEMERKTHGRVGWWGGGPQ